MNAVTSTSFQNFVRAKKNHWVIGNLREKSKKSTVSDIRQIIFKNYLTSQEPYYWKIGTEIKFLPVKGSFFFEHCRLIPYICTLALSCGFYWAIKRYDKLWHNLSDSTREVCVVSSVASILILQGAQEKIWRDIYLSKRRWELTVPIEKSIISRKATKIKNYVEGIDYLCPLSSSRIPKDQVNRPCYLFIGGYIISIQNCIKALLDPENPNCEFLFQFVDKQEVSDRVWDVVVPNDDSISGLEEFINLNKGFWGWEEIGNHDDIMLSYVNKKGNFTYLGLQKLGIKKENKKNVEEYIIQLVDKIINRRSRQDIAFANLQMHDNIVREQGYIDPISTWKRVLLNIKAKLPTYSEDKIYNCEFYIDCSPYILELALKDSIPTHLQQDFERFIQDEKIKSKRECLIKFIKKYSNIFEEHSKLAAVKHRFKTFESWFSMSLGQPFNRIQEI